MFILSALPAFAGPIQESLDRAPDGGTVTLRAGTYAESIVIRRDVSLVADEPGRVVLTGDGRGNPAITYAGGGGVLSGLRITPGVEAVGISGYGGALVISDVEVTGAAAGARLQFEKLSVSDSYFQETEGNGLEVEGAVGSFAGVVCNGNAGTGMLVRDSWVEIDGSYFGYNGNFGLVLLNGAIESSGTWAGGNVGGGVFLEDVPYFAFDDLYVEGSEPDAAGLFGDGVDAVDSQGTFSWTTVVTGNGRAGIAAVGSSIELAGVLLYDNMFHLVGETSKAGNPFHFDSNSSLSICHDEAGAVELCKIASPGLAPPEID